MPTELEAVTAFTNGTWVNFMDDNLVLAPTVNATANGVAQAMTIKRDTWTAVDANDQPIDCFRLRKAKPGEPSFMCYIADYQQGTTTPTQLGGAASFCFTVNMNGCTFGVGSQPDNTGACRVTHGNAKGQFNTALMSNPGVQAPALQAARQYTEAKELLGVGASVFEPSHYRNGDRYSVTFLYRAPASKWVLYYVSYQFLGNARAKHFGLLQAPLNTITN